jgi:peptidoglycan-associated lipoprotein
MRSTRMFVLASAALFATACASNPKPEPTPPAPVQAAVVAPPRPAPVAPTPVAPPAPIGPASGSKADFAAKSTDRVYFDYDQYSLDDSDKRSLATQVSWLRQFPTTRVEIQGHADERGTREYNIALGARRADAVASYLKSQGVDARRIQTVSFGKDKPLDQGHDEAAWSRNRNAYTNVITEAVS